MEQGQHRPWALQSTLKREVPPPLDSDQYLMLREPGQAPLLKQALCWKTTPMGWDAVGQSWPTRPSGGDEETEEPWYSLASGTAQHCRQQARGERDPLPPAYGQHLWEGAWWDPIVPAAYPGPCTCWGAFLWQERPILGKEYVVTCSQSPWVLRGSSGYVPMVSFCCLSPTIPDVSTWSLLYYQPSTSQ